VHRYAHVARDELHAAAAAIAARAGLDETDLEGEQRDC
jgi:hypothetical protein